MNLSGSVGWKGRNQHSDVKQVQQQLKKHGFPQLADDGLCGSKTVQAIRMFQLGFMRRPDGLIDPHGATWRRLSGAPAPSAPPPRPVDEHPIAGLLTVSAGQVTFDAEGNDIPNNRNFSRRIHWPGNAASGVTLGRGYDLGNRSQATVYNDLIRAGVPDVQAGLIAEGAGKKGEAARLFVQNNRDAIGTISHAMQIRLFEIIYPAYVTSAKSNYESWTRPYPERVSWENLSKPIREIMIDFVYQGFTKGEAPMKAGMKNNIDELINYIEGSPTMRGYEAGRQRANYLRRNR